jgi:hypothetical protein
MIYMKPVRFFLPLLLTCFVGACAGAENATGSSNAAGTFESLTKDPSSKTRHEDGWTIISSMEDGDRVYWFLAPDIDNVSPAMFKKIIFSKDKSKQGFEVVSKCDAPKQVCEDLMKQFKTLSGKYN